MGDVPSISTDSVDSTRHAPRSVLQIQVHLLRTRALRKLKETWKNQGPVSQAY